MRRRIGKHKARALRWGILDARFGIPPVSLHTFRYRSDSAWYLLAYDRTAAKAVAK